MRTNTRTRSLGIMVGMALSLAACSHVQPPPPKPRVVESLVPPEQAAQAITLREVAVRQGEVTGLVVNQLPRALRDVRLLIRHTWFWQRERKPGRDNPSRAEYYTLPDEVPARGHSQFTYPLSPPLPKRRDGHFETSVTVVRYTEVGE